MNADQEKHLANIIAYFRDRTDPKYRKGAVEHGSLIWEMTPLELIDNALDEAVDQFVYLTTLRQALVEKDG